MCVCMCVINILNNFKLICIRLEKETNYFQVSCYSNI